MALGDADLPDDLGHGKTGLPCMDGFIGALLNSGYVHNHGRMWLASYVLHHRKVDWRAAADCLSEMEGWKYGWTTRLRYWRSAVWAQ